MALGASASSRLSLLHSPPMMSFDGDNGERGIPLAMKGMAVLTKVAVAPDDRRTLTLSKWTLMTSAEGAHHERRPLTLLKGALMTSAEGAHHERLTHDHLKGGAYDERRRGSP